MRRIIMQACLAGVATLALTATAHAQTAVTSGTPATEADQTETAAAQEGNDIIVTAQKRSERLQDVPLAITAVTADTLQNRNITDTRNLTQVSPSLTYTQGANPTNSTFRIRGIGTAVFGLGTEPSVAVVMDGVVLTRSAQGFADIADIERIEVLRGPQGTLFGKNATAGLINVVTQRPTEELSGRFTATIAEKGEYHANGTVSTGLASGLSARVTGYYNNDDGIIFNTYLGRKTNGYESWGVRGKLQYETGALNVVASAAYDKYDATCCQQVFIRSDNASLTQLLAPIVASPQNLRVNSNLDTTTHTKSQLYSLQADYDLGGAAITSITALQRYKFFNNNDVDNINTAVPIYTGGTTAPFYAQFDVNGGPFSLRNISQELRIASTGSNRLNYVVGGFYSDLGIDRSFTRRIVTCAATGLAIGATCPAASVRGSSGSATSRLDGSHIAGFGQIDYRLIGGLKAIAGLRYQHETIAVRGAQDAAAPFAGDTPMFSGATLTSGYTKSSDNALTGRGGFQYEFSRNAQAYATYTRGYKGQSLGTEFNQTFNNNPVVQPEHVNAYEVGFKGSTFDRGLTFSASLFQADYTNLQVQANKSDNSTGTFLFVVTNAGKARTRGFEVEATARPNEHLSVAMTVAYVKGTFDSDGIACPLQNQLAAPTVANGAATPVNTCFRQASATGVLSGRVQNIRGGILPNTPRWRVGVNPHYETPVGGLIGYADANLLYQSDVNFSLEQDPLLTQDGYPTIDLAIGVRPQGKGISASVFVKNLTDQRFFTAMAHAAILTAQNVTPNNLTAYVPKNALRYIGASVGYRF